MKFAFSIIALVLASPQSFAATVDKSTTPMPINIALATLLKTDRSLTTMNTPAYANEEIAAVHIHYGNETSKWQIDAVPNVLRSPAVFF